MKRFLLLSFVVANAFVAQAQDTVYVYSHLEKLKPGAPKGHASYYCINDDPTAPLQGLVNFYDKKGNLHAGVEFNEKGIRDGLASFFYKEGSLQMEQVFRNGSENGSYRKWYRNGQLQEEGEAVTTNKPDSNTEFLLFQYWDSLGTQLLKGGQGELILHHENGIISEKGIYEEGRKAGKWTGYYNEGSLYYEEEYQQGKLINGKGHKHGKVYAYTQLEVDPQPKGGMPAFYKTLAKNIEYPREAVRFGIQGTVFVRFVIDENGKVEHAEYIEERKLGYGLDEEAIRVIYLTKWEAGKSRGIKTKKRMILPVKYKLAG